MKTKQRKEESFKKPLEDITTFEGEQGKILAYGTGRRKNSTARVWLSVGTGNFKINDRKPHEHFETEWWLKHTLEPLSVTHTLSTVDVNVRVYGGGKTGQAGAIRLGLSRALQKVRIFVTE